MQSQQENLKLTMKVEELQNQLQMYESVKNEYLGTAPKDEQQEYQELMDKLVLLQEEAKSEKDRLNIEAKENAQKAQALNKYQQMIRNIMNANKVAKTRIATRDEIIVDQDTEIDQQKENIDALESDVAQKKAMIEKNEQKIAQTEAALDNKMAALKQALKRNKLTKAAYQKQVKAVQAENEKKLAQLKGVTEQYEQQLNATSQKLNQASQALAQTQSELMNTQGALTDTQGKLANTQGALANTQGKLATTEGQLAATGEKLKGLAGQLAQKEGEAQGLRGQIGELRSGFAEQQARERAAFEGALARERLSGAEKAGREAAFRKAAEGKAAAMGQRLAGLEGQLKDTEGALAKAKEEMDARKQVARDIQKAFAAAGVRADVDTGTGEVLLDFGDAYFESGSSRLKPEMMSVLKKAMPAYSKSLFGDPKIANKISAVEVVGFASPTYKGRFIDPTSTKPEDRQALKYNMDLSYQRANAIFQALVDGKSGNFQYRQELTPLMKVSGRSFLEVMNVQNRNVANAAEFCRVNDCKKAQRVIIRFSMDGKKR
jgi:chromosome segregation ATPase